MFSHQMASMVCAQCKFDYNCGYDASYTSIYVNFSSRTRRRLNKGENQCALLLICYPKWKTATIDAISGACKLRCPFQASEKMGRDPSCPKAQQRRSMQHRSRKRRGKASIYKPSELNHGGCPKGQACSVIVRGPRGCPCVVFTQTCLSRLGAPTGNSECRLLTDS